MKAKVRDCIIYPLKSGQGIRQTEATVVSQGLAGDRKFMLVDRDGHYLNQNHLPELAQFSFEDFTKKAAIRIINRMTTVTVCNDTVSAFRAHDETNAALSAIFGRAVGLVMFPVGAHRNLDPAFSASGDTTFFANEFPVLITSQSSLDTLATHFRDAVTMDRFRANIVMDGLPPFAEDAIGRIKIGNDTELEIVKDCARCAMTTIDQKTGAKNGPEPLATLNQLRRGERNVYFGVYAIPRKVGTIRPDDTVEILGRRSICPDLKRAKINGLQF